ncbi:carbohydrate esterase family 3 protein [Patellaria atrata CBS 101060]|uniref:Carbohydrate esterase family 3 protein n=1 Tax=Patellaria atrata CBS 101060 TaxID=1346257 RepID=A0A9P4S373_9PEZI|nr:carbohydrate esterase family 3 protein [Patellaria atrata CBS 101060]
MVKLSGLGGLALLISSVIAQTSKIRYMPFGDSITEIVCWRGLIWQQLQQAGYTNIDFVGSGTNGNAQGAGCRIPNYDKDNEGHSGFLAINIANQNQLVGWLQRNPADLITMHLGTNDIVQQNKPVNDIITAFTKLVGQMRASNPNMKIIVAQIIPIQIGNYNTQIQNLNKAIIPWAQGLNQTNSPIWVVDQYTGYNAQTDLRDGVHPNDAGDTKMAARWWPALVNAINVIQGNGTTTGTTAVTWTA